MQIYLDNAATTRVCPEAARAALSAMTETYGNPSSTHTMGREAKKLLEASRAKVAAAMGAAPDELYFTSGGTESINWALKSAAACMKRHGNHIISSAAEHSATLRTLDELEKQGFEVTRLKPQESGYIAAEDVQSALREDTILVSLMLVNNETGALTDINAISKILRERGSRALLHTDAVQAFGKLPFTLKALGADLISISGHKLHAPKGVGALYVSSAKKINLAPLLVGGSQESSKRAGTEALPLIAAFGVASEIATKNLEDFTTKMWDLKALAINHLTALFPMPVFISGGAPHILSISLPGHRSEVLMNYLEARGIYVSKSSACKKGGRSHVLEAMGLSPILIDGALRIGISRYTTSEEIEALCTALEDAARELQTALR